MKGTAPRGGARTPHLVLVGLPGAGKSTVGRLVAEATGRRFLDFDQELERREGMRVSEIFARRGEPWFRDAERRLTAEVADEEGMVLAPGGGWVTNPELVDLLRPPALIVYLKVRPDTALARMGRNVVRRPLLSGDPLAGLRDLLERRAGRYEAADVVLDTELLTPQEVTKRVVALLSR